MASWARASLFVTAVASLPMFAVGCSSKDSGPRMVDNTGASAGSSPGAGSSAGGASGNGSGGNGSGSAGSASSTAGGPPGCMILPVQNPMITEFTPPEPGATGGGGEGGAAEPGTPVTSISFGYDANPPTVASGYSFFYPEETLVSDMSEGAWRISGSVADYAGFAIAFACGADAAAYQGISFKVSGNVGPTNTISFAVAHAADAWRDPAGTEPTAARCMSAKQYDGTCMEASAAIEVGEAEETISLTWADIVGGKPAANPDPTELMALRWLFKWDEAMAADAAANAYDVDVQIDDLTFIE